MTLIIPTGHCNILMNWTGDVFFKGRGITQFGAQIDEISITDVPEIVIDAWADNLRTLQTSAVTLESVVAQTEATEFIRGDGRAGTGSGSPGDPQVSMLVKKATSNRGRRAQGRMFMPGLVYEATYGRTGLMSESDRNVYQAAFNNWALALAGAGVQLVVLQNEEGITPPISPPPIVDALVVDQRAGTQRRRNRS